MKRWWQQWHGARWVDSLGRTWVEGGDPGWWWCRELQSQSYRYQPTRYSPPCEFGPYSKVPDCDNPDLRADDPSGRLYVWCMALLLLSMILFQTPVGPLGIPIAIAGIVCGVYACRGA